MRFKTFSFLLLLLAIVALPMSGQSVAKRHRYYSSASFYYGLGSSSLQKAEALSFTYRFSPSSHWGTTLNVGHTGSYLEKGDRTYFTSLLATILPVNGDRFHVIPALGLGVADGNVGGEKFTRLFFDVSVAAQYFVWNTMYCGMEFRYMTNGKASFTSHLLGMKIGFTF